MIGLDTNVIVRLMVQDDPAQTAAAKRFIAAHCTAEEPGYINHAVLVEMAWVLKSTYRYSRQRIADAIEALMENELFHIAQSKLAQESVQRCRNANIDFADALIGFLNKEENAEYTITFDRAAAKLPEFKLLKG